MMKTVEILIVEDEFIIALEMKRKLERRGYVAYIVPDGQRAIDHVRRTPPDLILMDVILLNGINGIQTAVRIHEFCDIPIIYVTGNSNLKEDIMLLDRRAFAILTKPPLESEIFDTIERALLDSRDFQSAHLR